MTMNQNTHQTGIEKEREGEGGRERERTDRQTLGKTEKETSYA